MDNKELAWELYCKTTAGSMSARDFWEELPDYTQQLYLNRVAANKIADSLIPFVDAYYWPDGEEQLAAYILEVLEGD